MLACAGILLLALAARPAEAAEKKEPYRGRPAVPFLLSAILPGAGQLYLGENRGYVLLGLDAATWFARFAYLDASDGKMRESRHFADRHWDLERYRESEAYSGCDAFYRSRLYDEMSALRERDPERYYSNLARQDSLRAGWDDAWNRADPDSIQCGIASANRQSFRDLRSKSDDLKNTARLALVVAVLNRVLSSVDALRLAKRRGEARASLYGFHLETDLKGSLRHPRAEVRLVKVLP